MDVLQLYRDHGVHAATEGEKHTRPGWVNTDCPYCTGNPGVHLGYELANNYYYCWRCGWHPIVETISLLLRIPASNAVDLIKQYKGTVKDIKYEKKQDKPFLLPSHAALTNRHKKYLLKRNYDPNYIEEVWSVKGTGPISIVDGNDYKHRLLIPINWDGNMISYITRDITDRHKKKYLVCPKERETIHHKHILYGLPQHWTQTGICVEGVTDVWRFGPSSFATFGIEYKNIQVRWMAKLFSRVAVVFDSESQAIKQANKLVAELKLRGVDAFRVPIEEDPGSMLQSEADYLVKTILK